MSRRKVNSPDKLDLEQLISQFEELITLCERLQDENIHLRAKQVQLQSSHTRLVDKNELSRRKLETMITRLKTLEAEL
jgi:cell division protein ZapB